MLGGIKNIHCRRISSSMLCQLCISRHWRLQIMTLAPDLAFAFLWGRMSVSGSADTAEQRGKPEQSRCFTRSGNTLYRWLTPTIHPHTHTHFQFSLNPPIKHQIQDLFCCEVDHNRIPVRHNTAQPGQHRQYCTQRKETYVLSTMWIAPTCLCQQAVQFWKQRYAANCNSHTDLWLFRMRRNSFGCRPSRSKASCCIFTTRVFFLETLLSNMISLCAPVLLQQCDLVFFFWPKCFSQI